MSGIGKAANNAGVQIGALAITATVVGPKIAAGLQTIGTAIMAALGSWVTWVAAAIAAGIWGYNQYLTAASRAATQSLAAANAVKQEAARFEELSAELASANKELKKHKEGTKEHEEAAGRQKELIRQITEIYPAFNQYLYDENGKQRDITEALRLQNDERKEKIRLQRVEAQAALTALEADKKKMEAYAESAYKDMTSGPNLRRIGSQRDAGQPGDAAVTYAILKSKIEDATLAIKKQEEAIRSYDEALNEGAKQTEKKKAPATIVAAPKDEGKKTDNAAERLQMQQRMEADSLKTLTALRLADLDDERAMLAHKVAMGQMTIEQRLEAEEGLLERRRAIELQALEQQIEIHSGEVEAIARLNNQKELLDRQYASKKLEIEQKLALEAKAGRDKAFEEQRRALEAMKAPWQRLSDSINTSMENCFIGLVNATMSWRQATQNIMNTVLQHFIQMAAKEFASFVSYENLKTLFKKKAVVAQTAAKVAGAATEQGVDISTAITGITASANEAGAGAFASLIKIPYVGPVLAPAAMAAAIAAVMALMKNLKSAAGGWWEIPSDQLAMVHRQEMVLPAKFAAPLREMLMGGDLNANASTAAMLASINALNASVASRMNRLGEMGVPFGRMLEVNNAPVLQDAQRGQRGQRGCGEEVFEGAPAEGRGGEVNIHIHAIDAPSFKRYLQTNRDDLVQVIKSAHRDNAFYS